MTRKLRVATTLCEVAGVGCAIAGTALLYALTVAGGLLATALLLFGASWVLSAQ